MRPGATHSKCAKCKVHLSKCNMHMSRDGPYIYHLYCLYYYQSLCLVVSVVITITMISTSSSSSSSSSMIIRTDFVTMVRRSISPTRSSTKIANLANITYSFKTGRTYNIMNTTSHPVHDAKHPVYVQCKICKESYMSMLQQQSKLHNTLSMK